MMVLNSQGDHKFFFYEIQSKLWHQFCYNSREVRKGFTFIELIILILAIGVLSVAVTYRYFSRTDFTSKTAYDQLLADIRYLKILAMGSLEEKELIFTPGSQEYVLDGERKKLPEGISVSSTTLPSNSLKFDSLGEPVFGDTNDRIITLSSGQKITIYAITGKAE
jgi:type II secretory pathway pseudopilin PulG